MSASHNFKIQVDKHIFGTRHALQNVVGAYMKSSHIIGVLSVCTHNSKELCRSVRKPRLRTRSSQKSFKTSSSDEENGHTTSVLSEYPLTMSSSKLLVYFTVFPGSSNRRCREEFTEYFACFNLIFQC